MIFKIRIFEVFALFDLARKEILKPKKTSTKTQQYQQLTAIKSLYRTSQVVNAAWVFHSK